MRKNIIVTPASELKNNLHLKLLYQVLKKHGYKIYPFNLKNIIKNRKKAIWHIHWADNFYRGTIKKIGIHDSLKIISLLRVLSFIFLLIIIKLCGIKIVWSVHNIQAHEHPETWFERFINSSLLKFSDKVTGCNEYIRSELKKKYNYNNALLMRQGIYEDCYITKHKKQDAQKILGIDHQNFVLLLFGSLLHYKGVDIIIDALKLYQKNDITLVIAGSVIKNLSYGRTIKRMAAKDKRIILFDKYISEKDIPVFFGAADYSIYPYRYISNSGVLFLSLTFGIPVIISNKGGVKEIIKLEPESGILINNPTPENILNAIITAKNKKKPAASTMCKLQEKLSWRNLEPEIINIFNFI